MTVARAVGIPDEHLSTFKVTCWEDNSAAETLANLDPGSPRISYSGMEGNKTQLQLLSTITILFPLLLSYQTTLVGLSNHWN